MADQVGALPSFSLYLHIVGIFLIFFFSVLGPLLPLLATRFQSLNGIFTPNVIRVGKFFGTGCIFATAYVHLLFPAATALNHPSLPRFFTETYPPLAGALALAGTFLMILLDYLMMRWKTQHARTASPAPSLTDLPKTHGASGSAACPCDEMLLHALLPASDTRGERETKQFGFYMLEIGIALHSVIVGFTLGLTPDNAYTSMLVAVIFHQFFEGFALGALAAPLRLTPKALWVLIIFFSFTTTFGAALGTLLQAISDFRADSPVTLIVQGVMSAVSAGIMLYSAILDVIVPELKEPSFYHLPGAQQFLALCSMVLGASIMSLLAKWA